MFCKNCGAELAEDAKFCPSCGASTGNTEETKEVNGEVVTDQPAKVWFIFGKIAHIIGIVGLIISFIPIVSIMSVSVCPVGIVFAVLAEKKANYPGSRSDRNRNIAATIIGFVMYVAVVTIAACVGAMAEGL